MSDADRIVLVFATKDPISHEERQALENVKLIGRERLTKNFDVEEISLNTIWEALEEVKPPPLSVQVKGQFVEQSSGLLVGTVSLPDLFEFMRAYKSQTGDLNSCTKRTFVSSWVAEGELI